MSPRDEDNLFHRLNWGRPIRLRWSGWETDTYRLKNHGWNFYADEGRYEEQDCWRIHLAASSPDGQVVISGQRLIPRGDLYGRYDPQWSEQLMYSGFDMDHYTIKDIFRTHHIPMFDIASWSRLTPVDIKAETFVRNEQIYYLRDFRVFKPLEINEFEKQIYVPQENVDDLFNKILQIQFKESKLQKKLLIPETKPIVQARIFSL